MKRFQVWSGGQMVAETDLEMHDPGMNVYSGRLYATASYQHVRPVFKAFAAALGRIGAEQNAALEEYFRRRDDVELTIHDGEQQLDADWIHIIDLEDSLDDLQIEVSMNSVLDPSG
jgi:hypothetical protein